MSDQTFTTQPSFAEQAVPKTNVKAWAEGVRAGIGKLLHEEKQATQVTPAHEHRDALEKVQTKLVALESAIINGTSETLARQNFVAWVEEWPYQDALQFYLKEKEKADKEQQRIAAQRLIEQRKDLARSKAIDVRKKYSVKGDTVGTVICGLVDLTSGNVWIGTSGAQSPLNTVMKDLLRGTKKVEKWPVDACGEVDAMNQYLNAHPTITKVSDIPPDTLYFHAETWNVSAGKWQARGACKNCKQWFEKIDAGSS